jgi:nicotinamide-nucleotide adenylyltransferase
MRKKALFVGRFQPFHLGHLFSIKHISENYDLIILIGSKQYYNTKKNPFSIAEREEMVKEVLESEGINYKLFSLDDINDFDKWAGYVKDNLPHFDIVFSSNDVVRKLFSDDGVDVKDSFFELDISGEKIREMIRKDNTAWKTYVHPLTAKHIKDIDGIRKIKESKD